VSPIPNLNPVERPPNGAALVVSGGDGTLFHLLQFLRPPYPPVTMLPGGRGNALARDLRLRGPGPVEADLMEVQAMHAGGGTELYICSSSVGLGYPTTVTKRSLKFRRLRRLSYAAAALFTLPRAERFEVSFDGGPSVTLSMAGLLINNTRHVGGFLGLPGAAIDDGQLDAMDLAHGYVGQMAYNLSSMLAPGWWRPARVRQIREAWVRPARPKALMLDGELLPEVVEIRVRVLPGALPCRPPAVL
jgi:diacylglycerol kinase family enzyme